MHSGAVEVWTARPEQLGCGACAELAAVLDAQERERAAKLRFEADRRAFTVAHAMRRIALGLALAADPHDLRFGSSGGGAPVLIDSRAAALSFSLSRSRELVAFALCAGGPIGIDVEPLRDGVEPGLLEPYMALPAHAEPIDVEGFYVRWTALEAFWKAQGLGLSTAHPRIELQETGEDCFDVRFEESGQPSGLRVIRLPAPPSHVLSVACRDVESVRIVELDRLARMPGAGPQEALSSCKHGHTSVACAPNIFSS